MESLALKGADIVRRIQEFSRQDIDVSAQELIDINQLLMEAIEVTRPIWKDMAQGKGLLYRIETRFSTLPKFMGNPDALKETFYNLVVNAIEASEQGGDIVVETHSTIDTIIIRIVDNGKGISPEVKKKAFDPFFTTKGPQGSGLGLSMAYSTVVRHGGEIELKENPGGGTVVEIAFPITKKIPLAQSYVGEGKNILVIEDEEHIQELVEEILRINGYKVWKADSGQQGMEIFQKEDIHLVLTDLGMPSITGWEVARYCKSMKKQVPVILLTGWKQFDVGKAESCFVDAILEKPFKIEEMLQIISALLSEGTDTIGVQD
jgi:CheY-like chemotaxis protein